MTPTALIAAAGYSRSGTGRGPGIELLGLSIDEATGAPAVERLAVVELPDPSFVLWSQDGTLLHAVLEGDPTRVVAVRVSADGREAEVIGDLAVDGAGGCHLSRGTDPSTLIIAQYGTGTVVTVRLDDAGIPIEQIDLDDHRGLRDSGDNSVESDLGSPHPHQVVALPGTQLLAVPDLGLDRVLMYRQDGTGMIDLAGEIPLHRGSGPRHLAADHESEQLHIACELSGMVATAVRSEKAPQRRPAPGTDGPTHQWSVRSRIPASGRDGANAPSHIELTGDESALLVANRGPDTLSLVSLDPMRPLLVSEVEVGAHPRHFTQLGDLVLVAAQEGDRIDVLRRSGDELVRAAEPIVAPSVACLAIRP
ncbi:3-carboxymuconate cyclase [Brachybacterium avium]|uniref:3-carboxymuconate cyclase n=1 Tax=Brachybacterium avium TaxID=2017485 RepID=A0A220UAR4_9MICO|nr:beta-propeller fold lactonase family protein [Brachybacterium avium]ASK65197.1 3-carboxymuconate cyclase [Brachybacterium avium]